jgi:hypothetical protein
MWARFAAAAPFRRSSLLRGFAFLGLAVITHSYSLYRHDDRFHVEH